jgi:uncharacterized repeat protein (TIGR03803 family)
VKFSDCTLTRYAVGGTVAAIFASCGGSQPPIGSPGAMPQGSVLAAHADRTRGNTAYTVMYSFKAATDGIYPYGSLTSVDGKLYGTTFFGGGSGCMDGCGTVFAITKSGKETVLHGFGASGDGTYPFAGLIDVNGLLYGTTWEGGTYQYGTAYAITTSGTETVLHTFAGGANDGAYPSADLADVNGVAYGTTQLGGSTKCYRQQGCGTVFSIAKSGNETVLHAFGSKRGTHPYAGLLSVNGTLYGTTVKGGRYGKGTVFAITTSGKETVLYSFKGGSEDGEGPNAGLINVGATLYGTTTYGGDGVCGEFGCGTVFSLTLSGTETVIHFFSGDPDGFSPWAGLVSVKGTLYGTTTYGGNSGCGTLGCGIVFSITTSGNETVLHTFAGYPDDGGEPEASLFRDAGRLYGTTMIGGSSDSNQCDRGCGTVFSIKP